MRLKNSNIDWVGMIPEEWQVSRLKSICPIVEAGKRPPNDAEEILSIGGEHIQEGKFFLENPRYVSLDTYVHSKGKVSAGDVLVVKDGATIGKCMQVAAMTNVKMLLNEHVYRLPIERYYYYWIVSTGAQYWFQSNNMSTAQESIPQDTIYSLPILMPPKPTRERIVAYLNEKTAAIDARVAVLERKLAAFRRLKTSVINEAVTGRTRVEGASPRLRVRKMKDSGVDWIGPVPEEWEVRRVKDVAEPLQYGASEVGLEYDPDLPRYIRITDITQDGELKDDGAQSLSEEIAKPYLLIDGDILLARSGATVGKAFVYREKYGRSVFAGYMIRCRVDHSCGEFRFVYYWMLSSFYQTWKQRTISQATIQNIGADKYANLALPLPNIAEQRAIADYLDAECAKIDKMAALVTREIELYKKLKRSLINEVVTGKRQVA